MISKARPSKKIPSIWQKNGDALTARKRTATIATKVEEPVRSYIPLAMDNMKKAHAANHTEAKGMSAW